MSPGKKVRELRQDRSWSLAELAKRSGVALSSLSRIETGKMTGTLESHIAIAKALGVRLAELYASIEPAGPSAELRPARENSPRYVTSKGATVVLLASHPSQKKMLPALVTLERQKPAPPQRGVPGSERFVYVLRGHVEISVGQERFRTRAGDSLYFQAHLPHCFTNLGSGAAILLTVNCPATF